MPHATPTLASPSSSNDDRVGLFTAAEPGTLREPRETRRMLTLGPATLEPLLVTAVIRTVPLAATPGRRALPSWTVLLSLGAALVSLLALVLSHRDAQASFQPSAIDRGMVVDSLQTLSDYVGFEGHFALGGDDRTLVMTGSDLCGDDFPEVVPPAIWQRVVESGFQVFECSAAGTHARLSLHP